MLSGALIIICFDLGDLVWVRMLVLLRLEPWSLNLFFRPSFAAIRVIHGHNVKVRTCFGYLYRGRLHWFGVVLNRYVHHNLPEYQDRL